MSGFYYQVKLTIRDKMSIITLFLPLIMALVVNMLHTGALNDIDKARFAVYANEASGKIIPELERLGRVMLCDSLEQLNAAVINPNDDTIGVVPFGNRSNIILAGDEMSRATAVASHLNNMLYNENLVMETTILPRKNMLEDLINPLIALVLVSALFLGLTFNTINLVAEKEDGIVFVNDVLPLTPQAYLVQKIAIGFIGSITLTMLPALLLFNRFMQVIQLLPLVVLGGFVASVVGLIIGRTAENLMVSIVYIKVIMLVFMAAPMVVYMFAPQSVQPYFHILPSYTFYTAIIGILEQSVNLLLYTGILFLHCLTWFGIYRLIRLREVSRIII